MCLSAEVDLVASVAIGAVAVDTVRHVAQPREIMLGSLPGLFALHQFSEVFVWWSLDDVVGAELGRAMMWVYLTFALVVLPSYVPAAIAFVEPDERHRRAMWAVFALGAATSAVMASQLYDGAAEARDEDLHIQYVFGLQWPIVVVAGYLVATCTPLLLASWPTLRWYGVANIVAVAAIGSFAIGGIVSLWCSWAAISSVAIALTMRRRRRRDARPSSSAVCPTLSRARRVPR